MTSDPKNPSNFWNELKRRKVIRVIAMYAATAFVLLELVDIVAPALLLPSWTTTLVIVLLSVGFPIVVILSWIFDITPEGIRKTGAPDEQDQREEETEKPVFTSSYKLFRASNIIIALLLVAVCILLYPKIFNKDKLSTLRDEEGIISLAVLPFDNLSGDSSLYSWQNGISEYLINKLGNSDQLVVSSSQVVSDVLESTKRQVNTASLSPDIARKTASRISASTYITGNFIGKENDMSIMLNLVNTETGEVIWSTSVDGDLGSNYRAVLNNLADTVKNYMEIRALEERAGIDIVAAYPNSSEAYKHYIDGLNAIINSKYDNAIELLSEAYKIDSTFTFAAFYLAFAYCFNNQFDENLVRWTSRAHELKENLPPVYRPWIELWYAAFITKDFDDLRRYCDMMYDAALHSRLLLFDLAVTYESIFDNYSKGIEAFEKIEALNELWEDDWRYNRYYREYAWTLLMAERPDDAERIVEKGLVVNPDDDWLKLARGAVHIMKGDSTGLKASEEWLREETRDEGQSPAAEEHWMGVMYCWAKDSLTAACYFRKAYELDPDRMSSQWALIMCQLESNVNLEECLHLAESRIEKLGYTTGSKAVLGYCLAELGRYEEALSHLREAREEWTGSNKFIEKYIHEAEQALALQARQ